MRLDAASLVNGFLQAAATGDVATVKTLIGVMPSLVDTPGAHPEWGGTPRAIQVAAERGQLEVVDMLLDAGAEPDGGAEGYDGWRALHLALVSHPPVALRLMSRGARVDIWAASMLGSEAEARALLQRDPSVASARGPNDAPPLHFASTMPMVDLLLEAGADPNALDQYGRTAARCAAYDGRRRRLIAGFLTRLTREHDVWLGCALGLEEMVVAHLDAAPEAIDSLDAQRLGPSAGRGPAPLHVAVGLGEYHMTRLLLQRGADPNVRSGDGHLPLHYAAKHGFRQVANLLLEHGADPSLHDLEHLSTPRGWAEHFGQDEMAALLGR